MAFWHIRIPFFFAGLYNELNYSNWFTLLTFKTRWFLEVYTLTIDDLVPFPAWRIIYLWKVSVFITVCNCNIWRLLRFDCRSQFRRKFLFTSPKQCTWQRRNEKYCPFGCKTPLKVYPFFRENFSKSQYEYHFKVHPNYWSIYLSCMDYETGISWFCLLLLLDENDVNFLYRHLVWCILIESEQRL